jgi:hypothetical protein
MQTVLFQVEDSKLDTFLSAVNNLKDGLFKNFIVKNENELDGDTIAYMETKKFQEDKEYFQKSLKDFENDKTIALSHQEAWEQIESHTSCT